ncbi:monovalent cation/H(+) antiporter subunit G [Ruania suaedae]|uniref:cation:proton antiporter n=1 Tax=Ruania suaedae TaxID=2897774 RepID=UPI001E327A75|nr:monovalent cation/H(+) antiporter subunit G [Ruania suaedae]UFU02954.1 monovalent cation/H(+) antiporter subunit G [Ruania suaedae]
MTTVLSVIGNIAIVLGALVLASAALGILRFPDAYTRASAVGTAGGVGIVLVVTGSLLLQPTIPDLIKVIVIVLLQLGTSAIGSMALARAAFLVGSPLKRMTFDELSDTSGPNRRA